MQLTAENYFSKESNMKYMSVSQFKSFDINSGGCEAMALAEIKGEYERPQSKALLMGSYVDAYFEGSLDLFIAKHPYIAPKFAPKGHINIFTAKGDLGSDFEKCEELIARIESDPFFMEQMNGEKQVIKTGEIEGVPVKIKIDVLHPDKIVDLKCMRDFEPMWQDHQRMTFIEAWGYDLQGAVYQEITGGKLPFVIAAITKEPVPDLVVVEIPQEFLDERLNYFKAMVTRYANIKKGLIDPERCEHCDYCKATKKLTRIVDMRELIDEME